MHAGHFETTEKNPAAHKRNLKTPKTVKNHKRTKEDTN